MSPEEVVKEFRSLEHHDVDGAIALLDSPNRACNFTLAYRTRQFDIHRCHQTPYLEISGIDIILNALLTTATSTYQLA
jgi:hypothetical protein